MIRKNIIRVFVTFLYLGQVFAPMGLIPQYKLIIVQNCDFGELNPLRFRENLIFQEIAYSTARVLPKNIWFADLRHAIKPTSI